MAIPANRTFQELRDQVTKQIERITDPSNPRQASALLNALTKQRTIEELSSTDAQRERYRAITGRTWEQDFMSVREVRFMTIGGLTGEELIADLWRSLPNSRFKRFQELFCDPENWLLPRVSDGATGVSFLSAPELNTCSVHPCLVSPDRLPNKLLQDLGLVQWPETNPGVVETLRMKSSPAVIEGIKAVFDATRSLSGGNQRVRIIECPTTGEGTLYPNAATIDPRIVGSLVYIRDDGGADAERSSSSPQPWRPPQRIISFFPDTYATARKTVHQTAGYNVEIETIRVLIEDWKALNAKIETHWRKGASEAVKSELREELAALTVRSRDGLAKATNDQKRKADEFFKKIEEALQNNDKNIGAMMTRMVAAWRRLERRTVAIPHKSGFNEADRLALKDANALYHRRFERVLEALPSAASVLHGEISRHLGMFNTRFATESARHAATESVLRRMNLPVAALNNTTVRPFVAFAGLITEGYAALSSAIEQQNAVEARRAMVRITVASKLQRANQIFEELREYTATGTTVPLEKLVGAATKLKDLLNTNGIFPRTQVPEYDAVYKRVQEKASEIARGLDAHAKRGLDLGKRAEMYRNLRRFLDDEPKEPRAGEGPKEVLNIEVAAWDLLHGVR